MDSVWLWDGEKKGPVGLCKILRKSPQLIKLRRPNGDISIELEENVFSSLHDLGKVHTLGRMLYADCKIIHCNDLQENESLRKHLNTFNYVRNESELAQIQDQKYDNAPVAYFMSRLENTEFLSDRQSPYSWSFGDFMDILQESKCLWRKKYRRLPSGKRIIIMDDSPFNFCKQFRTNWSKYLSGKSDDLMVGDSMLYHFKRLEIYPNWGDSFTKYLQRLKFTPYQELNGVEKIEKQKLFGE